MFQPVSHLHKYECNQEGIMCWQGVLRSGSAPETWQTF
jgi:hypothetical protein